ncbi:MAG: hypothetical protein KJ556_21065, partial [Gammaproteobacteria bacterium]|nr:hypothetical protein [Gammaproteobacteria bacterium]
PYGIKVYKSDGTTLAFDSSRQMLRLHANFSGNITLDAINNHDFSALNYPPPVSMNRRFVSAWWAPGGVPPPFSGLFLRFLHWRLLKNESNLYYRIAIGFSDMLVGQVSGSGGYAPASVDYSGFIFAYK